MGAAFANPGGGKNRKPQRAIESRGIYRLISLFSVPVSFLRGLIGQEGPRHGQETTGHRQRVPSWPSCPAGGQQTPGAGGLPGSRPWFWIWVGGCGCSPGS